MKDKKIGFVGLGRMGANMARRLKDCGYAISGVFDINNEIKDALASELSTAASPTLADLTACSDIVFTVVTNDVAMDAIFFGDDNLFTRAKDTLFINCATLSPDLHRKLEAESAKVGAESLEACMASSIPQARNGEFSRMHLVALIFLALVSSKTDLSTSSHEGHRPPLSAVFLSNHKSDISKSKSSCDSVCCHG